MASRTRARVFRLTCELEFSTREIVPMPTPAARATSRMVVFAGTASIAIGVRVAFAPRLRLAAATSSILFRAPSLAHHENDDIRRCARPAWVHFWQEVKKVEWRSRFSRFRLDRHFLLRLVMRPVP